MSSSHLSQTFVNSNTENRGNVVNNVLPSADLPFTDFASYINCKINNKIIRVLVDTGSVHSIATKQTVERIGETICAFEADDIVEFRTANSSHLAILGTADFNIQIRGLTIPHKVHVVEHLTAPLILGTQYLNQNCGIMDYSVGLLTSFE